MEYTDVPILSAPVIDHVDEQHPPQSYNNKQQPLSYQNELQPGKTNSKIPGGEKDEIDDDKKNDDEDEIIKNKKEIQEWFNNNLSFGKFNDIYYNKFIENGFDNLTSIKLSISTGQTIVNSFY